MVGTRFAKLTAGSVLAILLACAGCILRPSTMPPADELQSYLQASRHVDLTPAVPAIDDAWGAAPLPRSLVDGQMPVNYWDLSVEEALQLAVTNSRVLRDLGGTVVRAPEAIRTIIDPAIRETSPTEGVNAALAAFDATYSANVFAEKNDRALNNLFTAGGTRIFDQDLLVFRQQVTKRAAAGTALTLRQNIDYDANNAPANLFPSAWNTNIEAEFRQPLLQGAGVQFNRIAGPSENPAIINGVVIARTRVDVSLADFELALRDLVSNVENAYWDLYYAYRDLDSKVAARDASLEIWRRVNAVGQAVGAEREAQAREQYYRFEEEVQNAYSGRPGDGTATNNGTGGGSFRGVGGVLYSERRLRLMLGTPLRDDQLIRPMDEPLLARVAFDWDRISAEAVLRRGELRRQRTLIRRRELELVASRNFLLPQFDVFGRYRWRGFGHDLLNPDRVEGEPFDNAFQNLTTGDFQEWQLGGELTFPVGFRRAHNAMRYTQLLLARERALLDEQERQVLYDLSNAYAEIGRAFQVVQTAYNRRLAAKSNAEILRARMEIDPQFNLDQLLDAERRFADADARYHRAAVEYAVAVKNLHFEKGTLLDYGQVYLAEAPPESAEVDALSERNRLQSQGDELLDYVVPPPPEVMTAP